MFGAGNTKPNFRDELEHKQFILHAKFEAAKVFNEQCFIEMNISWFCNMYDPLINADSLTFDSRDHSISQDHDELLNRAKN